MSLISETPLELLEGEKHESPGYKKFSEEMRALNQLQSEREDLLILIKEASVSLGVSMEEAAEKIKTVLSSQFCESQKSLIDLIKSERDYILKCDKAGRKKKGKVKKNWERNKFYER